MRVRPFPWIALLLPAAFAAAALLSRALLAHAPIAIATDLAQPLPVATTWHDFGRTLWMLAFGCMLLAGIPYAMLLRGILRSDQSRFVRLRTVLLLGACALGAALAMPVIFSSDVYAYGAYGLMDAHGISPYAHATLRIHDPLLTAAVWQWSNPLPACVYGPLFVWIAKICVLSTVNYGVAAQLLSLRILSSLALLACGPLLFLALARFTVQQRLAAAAGVILNPVAIWSAAEGHNDPLVLAFVLLGFIALQRFGYLIGAFLIAASALIKASGAAAVLVLALYAWPDKRRFAKIVAGFAGGILLTVVIARPFESGISTVLSPHGHYVPQFSAQFVVAQVISTLFGSHMHALELGIATAVVASGWLVLHGMRLALRGRLEGSAFVALGLWLLIPNPYPWYALWILPVAFLCSRTPAAWAIIAASLTIFLRYLPDVSAAANPDLNVAITICELALPLALLVGPAAWPQRAPIFEPDTPA